MMVQKESQDVLRRIRRTAQAGLLGHAIIFSGPGDRLSAARYAAAALECETPGEEPCLHCEACRKVTGQIHPDVIAVHDTEHKELSVETVRNLKKDVYISPNEGKRKIYLFDNCDQLNARDQNVLLKIVEEGPSYAAFFFCAENSAALLPTIRSRCVEWKLWEEEETDLSEAADFCRLLAGKDALAVVSFLVGLENKKVKREQVQALLQGAWQISAGALLLQNGKPAPDAFAQEAALLARRYTRGQLLRLTALLERYSKECDFNVNAGLVLGAVAAEWEVIL